MRSGLSNTFDAAVIGGGIAGCAAAFALQREGFRVALAERTSVYRDRVRGEGLAPWGAVEAARLGITEVLEHAGARELPFWDTWRGQQRRRDVLAQRDPHRSGVLTFHHHAAQTALLDLAARTGVHVRRPARATPDHRRGECWHVQLLDGEIRSRLLIIASGRAGPVRCVPLVRDPVTHTVTGALMRAPHADPDAVATARTPRGRLLAFPLREGLVRVYHMTAGPPTGRADGVAAARTLMLEDITSAIPPLARDAEFVGRSASFPGASFWPQVITGPNIAYIGDAAGVNDPSIGQGLAIALRDVREFVDALRGTSTLERALERYRARRARYFAVQRLVAIVSWTLDTPGPGGEQARNQLRTGATPARARLLQEIRRDPAAVCADTRTAAILLGVPKGDSSLKGLSRLVENAPYSHQQD
jgi:2-polyprenyl-6-methoxyphenol hydroxylase-like FAD-dependent oxidoreductase